MTRAPLIRKQDHHEDDNKKKMVGDQMAMVKKGPWSAEEDQKLLAYIRRYGIWNWTQMPKFTGLARSGKSCRLRWMNYLRPNIKHGNFTKEEEETIIKWQQLLGNRWSAIAGKLHGRTDNEIKNYWNTRLKKRAKSSSEKSMQNHYTNNGTSTSKSAPHPPAPSTTSRIKIDHPNVLESLSQEAMSSSSPNTSSTTYSKASEQLELETSIKYSLPINHWIKDKASFDIVTEISALLEIEAAVKGLEFDFWEKIILPPLEDVSSSQQLTEDFDPMFMFSDGLVLPAAAHSSLPPELSTDGCLVYDHLWES